MEGPGSHRGGVEDDLRVIAVIGRHHLARESGQSGRGWWLGHQGGLLGLEQEPGGGERLHENQISSSVPQSSQHNIHGPHIHPNYTLFLIPKASPLEEWSFQLCQPNPFRRYCVLYLWVPGHPVLEEPLGMWRFPFGHIVVPLSQHFSFGC